MAIEPPGKAIPWENYFKIITKLISILPMVLLLLVFSTIQL
jgi:hypothetical protein